MEVVIIPGFAWSASVLLISLIADRHWLKIVGWFCCAMSFLTLAGLALLFHMLHVGMSGDPGKSPGPLMLLIAIVATVPLCVLLLVKLKHTPEKQ